MLASATREDLAWAGGLFEGVGTERESRWP